jgi:hypothetical protein
MLIADTNEFHPLTNAVAYRDSYETDGSKHPVIIMRATYSTTHVDLAYSKSLRAARAAGLYIGHYGYMTASENAEEQGKFFADTVAANGGLRPGDTIWCDDEEGSGSQSVRALQWLAAAGRPLSAKLAMEGVYSGAAFWLAHLGSLPSGLHRWVAAYGQSDPKLSDESLWQFTDNRVVQGVLGPCDVSIYRGDLEQYLLMVGAASSTPSSSSYQEDSMLLNRGASARTPLALPTNATSVRFFSNEAAKLEVDTRDGKSVPVTLGYSSAVAVPVPAQINAFVVHRVDAGTNDVSCVINT